MWGGWGFCLKRTKASPAGKVINEDVEMDWGWPIGVLTRAHCETPLNFLELLLYYLILMYHVCVLCSLLKAVSPLCILIQCISISIWQWPSQKTKESGIGASRRYDEFTAEKRKENMGKNKFWSSKYWAHPTVMYLCIPTILWYGCMVCHGVLKTKIIPVPRLSVLETLQGYLYPC